MERGMSNTLESATIPLGRGGSIYALLQEGEQESVKGYPAFR